jgi:hypothetical protein
MQITMREFVKPMWHAITRDGVALVCPTMLADKDAEVAMARAVFELRDVVRYLFIDEAWMVEAIGPDVTPEQRAAVELAVITGATASPARQEVVMFSGEDQAEGAVMARRLIIRQGAHATLGPLQFDPPGGQMVGRFVGLLPIRATAH